MDVQLIAYTQLSEDFKQEIQEFYSSVNDRAAIALSAIRTCYSHNKPSEIVKLEGEKYFNTNATDGEKGSEADRLIRQIVKSKHLSTLEHINYTFSVEGVSRALLGQLTRHRHFSFSVQSQRYVRLGSDDKSGGFNFVSPESLEGKVLSEENIISAQEIFNSAMAMLQSSYDDLRKAGVPAEDARSILPQATTTNLVLTGNLRSILEIYSKRKNGSGAQKEIVHLVEFIKERILSVDPWLEPFFN
ncbi:thymidylate synthase, flavin-dependent [Paenibacillus odorifer]|uniref:FAD-dependent thymidylate synthase n=1 Tax=Paenibacillus odorifer TaxID=189426 RepID=UPI00096C3331|nr:FAD-dependent thymidylate synthase [Paenibacillus odorifer]OME55578.1 thymidylate synthase, flavin-dependent [Paenibacillus odorifer]